MSIQKETENQNERHRWFMQEFLPDGLPDTLYKFTAINSNLYQSIRDGYLWHSQPSILNDPFDCYKHLLTFRPTDNDIAEFCRRN